MLEALELTTVLVTLLQQGGQTVEAAPAIPTGAAAALAVGLAALGAGYGRRHSPLFYYPDRVFNCNGI